MFFEFSLNNQLNFLQTLKICFRITLENQDS